MESSEYPSKPENTLTLSYDSFQDIKNGIINSINGITYNEDKEKVLNDLQSVLYILNDIGRKEDDNNEKLRENEQRIIRKEYDNGLYEGQLKNDLRHGRGKMTWKDGDKYDGDWKNGKFEGNGKYFYNNGDRYEGEFKNDTCEGKGIYYYENGDIYEGEFKNWKSEGKGTYYYNSGESAGDKYVGDFKDDASNGKGIYYYKSGDRYEGDFKDDKKDGKGIYYYNNGDREIGDYLYGKPIGRHVKMCADGNVLTINY